MKIVKSCLWITLILPVLVLAAEKNETKKETAAKTPTSNPATVIATVDGKKLTWGEFQLLKKFSGFPGADERLVNLWKLNTGMAQKVRKEKFEDDPDVKNLLKVIYDQALVSFYIRYKQMNLTVTKEDVKEYYEKHKTEREFRELDNITAKIIAVDKDKRADLEAIKKQLMEGVDFDKIAEENRKETLKVTDLKDIEIKNVPGMELSRILGPAVAYSMAGVPLNEVKGPQAINKNNWILYKVTARTPGKQIPLEKISADLERMLLRQKKAEIGNKLSEQVEKELGIKMERSGMQQGMRKTPRVGR